MLARDTDSLKGLTRPQAAQRLKLDGPNSLPSGEQRTWMQIVWEAGQEPMFLLLFAAAGLYLLLN